MVVENLLELQDALLGQVVVAEKLDWREHCLIQLVEGMYLWLLVEMDEFQGASKPLAWLPEQTLRLVWV